jgi:uncharacterized protein YbjT (DUF2867 family)
MNQTDDLTLILGATGTTGRRVAQRLAALGVRTRLGSRSANPPDVGEPFVDADDIADVVVAALTRDGHSGQIYEVTGPRLLTFAEAIAEISAALGRDRAYQRIPAEQFITGLVEHGVPREEATVFAEIFSTVLDGRNEYLRDGVERALNRAPRDFTEYARDAAATGVWAS